MNNWAKTTLGLYIAAALMVTTATWLKATFADALLCAGLICGITAYGLIIHASMNRDRWQ